MRVGLLNVSHRPEVATRNFRRALDAVPDLDVDLDVYGVRDLDLPAYDDVDCAIITGSVDSVNDDRPYVHAVREWIREAPIPLLGVCFGHQAIAAAHGGRIERMREGEIGYRTATHSGDPLFDGVPEEFVAFSCHYEIVVEPPEGATVIARNERGVQALRIGDDVSIQFHPEIDREYGRTLVHDQDVPPGAREAALETITDEAHRASEVTRRVFENFLRGVASRDDR